MSKEFLTKKITLSDLVKRHKYRNVNNIISSRLYYFFRGAENVNLKEDIVDNFTATMAFRLIQHYINQNVIEKLCTTYVFKDHYNSDLSKIKDESQKIIELQQKILVEHDLLEELLDMPAEKTAKRYMTFITEWKGYRTYGDDETILASYLSAFCSYKEYVDCLNIIQKELKKNSIKTEIWSGLFSFLQENTRFHFEYLEKLIARNTGKQLISIDHK